MKKIFYTFLMLVVSAFYINAQTNPSPQSIPYTQNFSTLTGASPAYPAGWQGWTVSGSLGPAFATGAPNGDQAIAVVANTSTSSHVGDFIGKMGVMSTGSAIKAICLSLNTTLLSSIQVVYDAQTQRTENTRLNQLGLQYRIGTSGAFINVTGSGYLNQLSPTNTTGTGAVATSTKTVTLPAACDNQSVVQIRWIIRDSSGTGNRPGFSIDNINVTGTAIVAPSVSATPSTRSGFTYIEGFGPSAIDSFTISGSNLIADLIVRSPSDYQIDTNFSGSYYDSIYITPISGTIASRKIYVRLKSGLTAASSPYNQILDVVSSGATTQNVSLNGTVTNACIAPSSQATAFNFTSVTYNNIAASFTATTADGYMVVQSTSPSLIGGPSTGTTYTVGASVFGGTIISLGSGTTFNSTGLSSSTHYYYFIFAFNNLACGGGPAYNTLSPLTSDTTTLVAPCIAEGFTGTTVPALPAGWNFNLITGTYTSAGNFGAASPSVKLDAAGSQMTTFSLSPQMASSVSFWMKGQGTMTGSSLLVEGYVGGTWTTIQNITTIPTSITTKLYNASSTPALPLGVSQIRITYNKVNGNVAIDDIIVNCITMPACSEPTTQPSSVSFSAVTHNSMTINWTGGDGDSSLVVVRQSSPVSVSPLDGVSYNPTTVFGTVGAGRSVATGQFVVYASDGNSVNITNLLPSTTYHVAVFEYNHVISNCYLDTLLAVNSQLTSAPPIVISPTSLSTFNYDYGSGPSSIQNVSISASGLTPSSGNIVITPLNAAYEVATSFGGTYLSSVSLPYTSSALSSTPIYIRLKSGLSIGTYNTQLQATNDVDTTKINLNGNVTIAPCSNLFFSEYIEGTSNEKYFEIYNASNSSIDLANYKLLVYANGSAVPTTADSSITGIMLPHTTRVFKNASAVLYSGPATSTTSTFYNGDDALVLFDRIFNIPIDIIGRIGEDPGIEWNTSGYTTLDKTLIRKFSVTRGISTNPTSGFPTLLSEWDTLSVNTVSNLGIYRNVCCVPVSFTYTQTVCPGDLFVFNGETLTVSGTYLDTLANFVGCDSFITLNFVINAPGVGGCPTPPANDNLCNAMNITNSIAITSPYSAVGFANINTHSDTIYQNNGSSSSQVGEPIGSCGSSSIVNKTIWNKFTTPNCATPTVHISTDDRSTTNFDTRISVYRRSISTVCLGTYTEIACNDNAPYYLNTGATTNSSVILTPNSSTVLTTPLTNEYAPGEILYIQTSGVGTASGSYGLIIDAEPSVPVVTSVGGGTADINWATAFTPTWGGISGTYIQWRVVGSGPTVAGTYRYVTGPATGTTLTGLTPNTTYEYWASYVCGNGGRWWSKKGTFTTNASCASTVIAAPVITPGATCHSLNATFVASGDYTSYRVKRVKVGTSTISTSSIYYSSIAPQTWTNTVSIGSTYKYWVEAYCGTSFAYRSDTTLFTSCASSRMANPTEVDDIAYILPNGDVSYGMPIEMIANTTDMNNLGEQEITLQTMDANTYFGRSVEKEVIAKVGEMMIYPNPASTEATISYSLEKESASMSIKVIDAQGKEMLVDQITNPMMSGTYNINLNNYSAGIYFVKVQAGNYIETKKLIVDRK